MKRQSRSWKMIEIVSVFAMVGLSACAGADEWDESEPDGLGTLEQPWSVDSCGRNATLPNATFSGKVDPAHVSVRTYNTCFKSYVVDIDTLDSAYAGRSGADIQAFIGVKWGEAVPTTEAACEDTEGGAIFYQRSGSSWVALTGKVSQSGVWTQGPFGNFFCAVPNVVLTNPTAGTTYRVAATMRRISDGNPTRRVEIETFEPIFIR